MTETNQLLLIYFAVLLGLVAAAWLYRANVLRSINRGHWQRINEISRQWKTMDQPRDERGRWRVKA